MTEFLSQLNFSLTLLSNNMHKLLHICITYKNILISNVIVLELSLPISSQIVLKYTERISIIQITNNLTSLLFSDLISSVT